MRWMQIPKIYEILYYIYDLLYNLILVEISLSFWYKHITVYTGNCFLGRRVKIPDQKTLFFDILVYIAIS